MARKIIWIPLVLIAVVAIAAAGFLFVSVPASSDDLPPSAVTVETTITMPPGEPVALRHSTDQVSRAFRRAGLPVTRLPLERAFIVKPVGARLPDAVLTPRGGGSFAVFVYSSSSDAAMVVTAPAVDRVTGLKRTMLRDANVVVIVEPPRRQLEGRIRQALRSL